MPGVIMDHGSRNGSHTNHDRDQRPNGINGASHGSEKIQDKGKARAEPQQNMTPISPTIPNSLNGALADDSQHRNGDNSTPRDMQSQMDQLPQEIVHMTEHYMPLSTLLSRLAQKTHSDLLSTVNDLAQMPSPTSALNGNASYLSATEDTSSDNINKKLRLMNFATSSHEAWTKALVITGWSRKAEDVSKLIDLRIHLQGQKSLYTEAVEAMANNQRALHNFRLPNPDFKTALEALTTGKASWMPDLNYIQPPPLTAKDVLRSLEKLNTLLSIRLNLNDYDSIPLQFKDFTISSGRATFKVPGEFEIDLTIADEDPDSQYWFIDFRFLFEPSSSTLNPGIRWHIENKVNEILLKDGLSGCYKYLHELTLTYKINEFRRQGADLARSIWIDTLRVEILNRPISIQYWLNRYDVMTPDNKPSNIKSSKSWILLGVHSGRRKDGRPDPKATSQLFLRWFRESKEVKNVDIPLDDVNISTEKLLKTVIAKHVNHILTSMYEKLLAKPLFARRDFELSLHACLDDPADSELKVQLTNEHRLSVKIEPISGRFIFGPVCRAYSNFESLLNEKSQDPASDGHVWIERLRSFLLTEEIHSRALSVGWTRVNNPGLNQDILQQFVAKETLGTIWFRRPGWAKDWYLAVSQSMSGEKWHLIKTAIVPTPLKIDALGIGCAIPLPIKSASPTTTYSFLSTLHIFTAGMVSHYTNMRALHARRIQHTLGKGRPARSITLPSVFARLSELLPSKLRLPRTGRPWAKDIVRITFQGVETIPQNLRDATELQTPVQVSQTPVPGTQPPSLTALQRTFNLNERSVLITEARMIVPLPPALLNINEQVDKDIVFNSETGSFAFRLYSKVGESVIPSLVERMVRVERLVEFVQVLQRHENTLSCGTISLGRIIFTYQNAGSATNADSMDADAASAVYKATVDFGSPDNIMTLALERGNPHLRIADNLTKVLNGPEGLDGVATLLPLTLPIVRGLDAIETAWSLDELGERGDVCVNVRATDSYQVRYNLTLDSSTAANAFPMSRKVTFEIRLRSRRGTPWWYVRRTDNNSRNKELDALDESLKPLWSSSGPKWQGMRVSGVAEGSGAEDLLVKMDEIVRTFALSGKSLDTPPVAAASAPAAPAPARQAPAPNPRQQQQQRQQQPTPNQSQNQGQGRNNHQQHEIVVLD